MLNMYLMRHGETIWNTEGRKQGGKDSPLTLKGIEQAHKYANFLKENTNKKYTIVSSCLGRAKQTAQIISEKLGITYHTSSYLNECEFGLWEGCTENEIKMTYPDLLNYRYSSLEARWYFSPPGGQSYYHIYDNAKSFMCEYRNCDNIIVVTHEMIGKCILGYRFGHSQEKILNGKLRQGTVYYVTPYGVEECV